MFEFGVVKSLVVQMRLYAIQHNIRLGECVAWNALKDLLGIGEHDEEDAEWLTHYLINHPDALANHGPLQLVDGASGQYGYFAGTSYQGKSAAGLAAAQSIAGVE